MLHHSSLNDTLVLFGLVSPCLVLSLLFPAMAAAEGRSTVAVRTGPDQNQSTLSVANMDRNGKGDGQNFWRAENNNNKRDWGGLREGFFGTK